MVYCTRSLCSTRRLISTCGYSVRSWGASLVNASYPSLGVSLRRRDVQQRVSGNITRNSVIMAAAAPAATCQKLANLRDAMKTAQVDAFIVPSEDPHMSEYPPDCHARREFISGFDGSAGTAVVTKDAAALWTDGRYFLQAEEQLGPEWVLMRAGTPGVPDIHDWLTSTLKEGSRVGIDPTVHTIDAAEALKRQLEEADMELVSLEDNPVDEAWGDARPAAPKDGLRIHDMKWAGASASEKIQNMRAEMKEAGVNALAVTMLDEVAWLLNLRGSDVSYNPVFMSYVLITETSAQLFVDEAKIDDAIAAHLKEAGVEVRQYGEAFDAVTEIAKQGGRIWMDPSKVSFAIKVAAVKGSEKQVGGRKRGRGTSSGPVLAKASPVSQAKGVKNAAELAGHVEAHLRDGVALAKFLSWLDKTIASGKILTEVEIDEHLTAQRAAQEGFIEPSFPTIAGAGPNGAVIHYRAQRETCRKVDANTLLLIDSGGQYDCGTTDITRTMHFGTPTEHQKACYTAVLQGHIQLDQAIYPEGTPGCALDTLARTPLWRMGLNYRHGTGHGVGAALNVHEGPQSISHRFGNLQPLLPGMVCSNEPGYYEDGSFGIRIENLFIIVESPTPFRFGGQSYYGSERLTMCPIQKKMMNPDLMTENEINWVNAYHKQVYDAIAPRLEADQDTEALEWLKDATSPLSA